MTSTISVPGPIVEEPCLKFAYSTHWWRVEDAAGTVVSPQTESHAEESGHVLQIMENTGYFWAKEWLLYPCFWGPVPLICIEDWCGWARYGRGVCVWVCQLGSLGQSSEKKNSGMWAIAERGEKMYWRPSEVVRLLLGLPVWHHQHGRGQLMKEEIWVIVRIVWVWLYICFPFSLMFRHFLGFIRCSFSFLICEILFVIPYLKVWTHFKTMKICIMYNIWFIPMERHLLLFYYITRNNLGFVVRYIFSKTKKLHNLFMSLNWLSFSDTDFKIKNMYSVQYQMKIFPRLCPV